MNDYFEILREIYSPADVSLTIKYRQMRDLLERLCRELTRNEGLQMTDLAARINFLAAKYGLDRIELNRLHTFRLNSNRILNRREEPSTECFLSDLKTLAFTVRKLFGEDIPFELYSVLPKHRLHISAQPCTKRMKRLRVCFLYAEDSYLYVNPSDILADEPLKVKYNIQGVNDMFAGTVDKLWQHAQLNLLDVAVDEQGVYIPAFIVLEPDYLIDISSLAECFKDYGSHPANYNLSKLIPIANARPLLLGNIVNLFLDEWIHASGEVDYAACMQKAFQNYPIELAACRELKDREKELQFFTDCKMHFDHIRQTVKETFYEPGYDLNPEDAVLEPSYICEALGIQGRLDYMQRDMSSFIEMKSGKADEYAIRGKVEPKENNRVQMLLYVAALEYSMGQDHRRMKPYLFYTRYPLLYPSSASWTQVKKIIEVRNLIVASEYSVQLHNDTIYTAGVLEDINSRTMNQRGLHGRYWEQYLVPSIEKYNKAREGMSSLEQSYYLSVYNFITKELYTSKSGDTEYEGRTGASSLWLSTLAQKQDAGEIFYDLKIISNQAADKRKPSVLLSIPLYNEDFLPNFRQGDAVVLYERNSDADNATNKMVFKGSIEVLTSELIKVRIRATQRNISVLPLESLYAVEHDTMDTTFRGMYQGLYAFMTADADRRKLLLSQRCPDFDQNFLEEAFRETDDFERIALKALAAKDYFLLVGPPGTGKTSRALKRMVEKFHAIPDYQLLLLAYTNRAVDEICKSLLSITPEVDFIRVGSELSCEAVYREHLMENVLSGCVRRSQVHERISRCRIFVGTVASITNKPELFRLKTFHAAIVDEATQILEPQLLGILCAKDGEGKNAVGKFVLIGDHKQLPAVVLQHEEQSRVCDGRLNAIGITNLRDSLFERLYRFHLPDAGSPAVDMLCRQGRMNPAIALFPNQAFYAGKLESVGLSHQKEDLHFPDEWGNDKWERVLTKRLAFIPSRAQRNGAAGKTNKQEASIVAKLAAKVYACYHREFDEAKTIGIITPYRSQIALIKKELSLFCIPALNNISVDTVERFQGSERDIILYSFSINHSFQLKFLANLTHENGVCIDRKLNVALTRARKQLYITGVPELLMTNSIYRNLLKLIESTGGFTDLCDY